jgi:ATP/maltotriose-dependent transcriptional regulator MalT
MSSSRRFKKEIKPMDQTSQAILGLKPVTFQYKSDPTGTPQFGLIAEEVAKVDPDLVVRDAQGEIYSVRYEAVNAMLLNEFLKEHRKVEQQATTIAQQHRDFQASITKLEATVAQQQKNFEAAAARQQEQIEALTAGLQRVSAQVEMSRPARQMVLNNP